MKRHRTQQLETSFVRASKPRRRASSQFRLKIGTCDQFALLHALGIWYVTLPRAGALYL